MRELVEFRRRNNLTQEQLGLYLGMKKSFISKIENGRHGPPAGGLPQVVPGLGRGQGVADPAGLAGLLTEAAHPSPAGDLPGVGRAHEGVGLP